ncbi:ATP-dependent DNA ligase [Leifsonia sp. fls2-241-R2A-40a]|uniref:DUF7882 family protein n=1 Tax=Leifsonia sp. fls2-241-R2A-40a TaxID=3040290 RepID=UPI003305D75E
MMYDSTTKIGFDDRVLAHLEVVIVSKLRRKESFALTWREPLENGSGRSTVWLDVAIPLRFRFEGGRAPSLDRHWIEQLSISAASSTGLVVVDQHGESVYGTTHERGI